MEGLQDWIAARLDLQEDLDDEVKLLIHAALEGDEALTDLTGFTPPDRGTAPEAEAAPPSGAFLKQIKVSGFRGIGPTAQLDLKPVPGLTVVAGRNGSGKSSFAEALEVALTGTTYRWRDKRSTQWGDAWRNLHSPDEAKIEVLLAEVHIGQTKLVTEWALDAGKDQQSVWMQRQGEKRQAGAEALGWDGPLATYRPMLTYDELGALLTSEPSKLYDALSTVLGLEMITSAVKRLDERSKQLAAPGVALTQSKQTVTAAMRALDDERARRALEMLAKKVPNLDELRALATGTAPGESEIRAHLDLIVALSLPLEEQVLHASDELTTAVATMAEAGVSAAESIERRTELLERALDFHAHEGDVPCPVCGVGALNEAWADAAKAEVEAALAHISDLRDARAKLVETRGSARALIASVPAVLRSPLPEDLAPHAIAAVAAWEEWAEPPSEDLELAGHLLDGHGPLSSHLSRLQELVRAHLDERDDAWAKAAGLLAAYIAACDAWFTAKPEAEASKAAHKWLKENESLLKNERLKPIAEQASAIWGKLRQESNVELAGISLAGSATRRHVVINAAVDGSSGAGLAVMSQGELHALALALFLPRATMPESPFRFVVLDDPVQAMDPAKVDGLVEVLSELSLDRQVIVFSHDDRLAQAVRRAAVSATIVEVTRTAGSRVVVTNTFDPPQRYLRDAMALVKDDRLPESTLRQILPGLLRFAAEAQAQERYFSHAISLGTPHAEVEATWSNTHKTAQRVSLAIYGDDRRLDAWIEKAPHRKRALGICSTAIHGSLHSHPEDACHDVRKFVEDIRDAVR